MNLLIRAVLFSFVLTNSTWIGAHPGRTDSSGGHHDRTNGGYHYHNGGSAPASPPPVDPPEVSRSKPKESYRTTARTSARLTAREEPNRGKSALLIAIGTTPAVQLEPQFIVFMKNGNTKEIVNYKDDTSSYYIGLVGGGFTRYPKSLVERIEPIVKDEAKPVGKVPSQLGKPNPAASAS